MDTHREEEIGQREEVPVSHGRHWAHRAPGRPFLFLCGSLAIVVLVTEVLRLGPLYGSASRSDCLGECV